MQDRTVVSVLEEETHFSDSLSPDSPSSRESANHHSEAFTTIFHVAWYHNFSLKDDQRTTLEDYSSSSVP